MTSKTSGDSLAEFGRFLMVKLRDRGVTHFDGLIAGKWKAPSLKNLQKDLASLTSEQRAIVRRAVLSSIDSALHDFLFALQEEADSDGRIVARVDGENIADASDGLHGELFTSDGWFARYSAHGEPPEEA